MWWLLFFFSSFLVRLALSSLSAFFFSSLSSPSLLFRCLLLSPGLPLFIRFSSFRHVGGCLCGPLSVRPAFEFSSFPCGTLTSFLFRPAFMRGSASLLPPAWETAAAAPFLSPEWPSASPLFGTCGRSTFSVRLAFRVYSFLHAWDANLFFSPRLPPRFRGSAPLLPPARGRPLPLPFISPGGLPLHLLFSACGRSTFSVRLAFRL